VVLRGGPQYAWLGQLLRFLLVGVLNTLVDAGLYLALTRWLGLAAVPALAKCLSYGGGTLNSFYWNRTWTFKSADRATRSLLPFIVISLLSLALNAGAMHLGIYAMAMSEALALVLATAITFAFNFTCSKVLVFRKRDAETGAPAALPGASRGRKRVRSPRT
jgi:putative flippase GtrA